MVMVLCHILIVVRLTVHYYDDDTRDFSCLLFQASILKVNHGGGVETS